MASLPDPSLARRSGSFTTSSSSSDSRRSSSIGQRVRGKRASGQCTEVCDRDRLRSNLLAKQYVLEVDLDHLIAYHEELANRIRETPAEIMPLVCTAPRHVLMYQTLKRRVYALYPLLATLLPWHIQFEAALRRCAKQILTPLANRQAAFTEYDNTDANARRNGNDNRDAAAAQTHEERIQERDGPDVQVVLRSGARSLQFRDLHVCPPRQNDALHPELCDRHHTSASSSACPESSSPPLF